MATDERRASEFVFVSTIFSVITLPLVAEFLLYQNMISFEKEAKNMAFTGFTAETIRFFMGIAYAK